MWCLSDVKLSLVRAAKRGIEPVKNASCRETISAALAVCTGILRGCERIMVFGQVRCA